MWHNKVIVASQYLIEHFRIGRKTADKQIKTTVVIFKKLVKFNCKNEYEINSFLKKAND